MLKKTYTRMKNYQLLWVLLFNLFVLSATFLLTFNFTRLSGSYHVQVAPNALVSNDTLTIHVDDVIGNLNGSDSWTNGSYELKQDQLKIYLDDRVYYGEIDKKGRSFWLEIDNEKVYFRR